MIEFIKNRKYGYWEVQPKPNRDELRLYYEKKYYQQDKASYTQTYTDDEMQYFSVDSLRKLCSDRGLSKYRMMTGFPIEWYLANDESNYVEKKNVGKQSHSARVYIENFIHSQASVDEIVHMYEAMLRVGVGRQIIGFFQQ